MSNSERREYFVSVVAGPYDDELAAALGRTGIARTGGYSSRTSPGPGGELPPIDGHTLVLDAASEEDARKQVTAMSDSINRPHTIERVEPVAAD
jgi:hypothetical protein